MLPVGEGRSPHKQRAVPAGTALARSALLNARTDARESSKAAAAAHQPHDQEQDDGADRRIDDLGDEAGAKMNAELWENQGGNQRAGDADQYVADDAEAGAADDLPGQPTRHKADEQDDDNAFVGQNHRDSPISRPPRRRSSHNPTHRGGM